MVNKHAIVLTILSTCWVISGLKVQGFDEVASYDFSEALLRAHDDLEPLAFVQLEEHEDTPTPPFSVCKYLLETAAGKVTKDDKWPEMAKHIADIRNTLPDHVRSACDAFIKSNRDDIVSLLQIDDLEFALDSVAAAAEADDIQPTSSKPTTPSAADAAAQQQQDQFKQFWENKGKYCGACLTITKKLQKWLSLNCTQTVIADRITRMCSTMPDLYKAQCEASRVWIKDFVIKQLFSKFPLPNHCAYIGLCEKTMVVRALMNPMTMGDTQNALIQDIAGTQPNLAQEGDSVLQRPHNTPNTAPEITFDLDGGSVSYRDVDKSTGDSLPKVYIDGSTSLLETEAQTEGIFDLSNPDDPKVMVNAQNSNKVNVPVMHADLKKNLGMQLNKNAFGFGGNHLPIETKYLKGCAACQFTLGALFEFMSNPRTIRTLLPAVKQACNNCNSPDEIQKCQEFVEMHGVAFYQDVLRQGMPSKWCPRLELCEIQYFLPSPFVLSDSYSKIRAQVKQVDDF